MTKIVTDTGFASDTWEYGFVPVSAANISNSAVDLESDFDPYSADETVLSAPMIRIDFPTFADGRGFTLAAQLRRLGYQGRLRAKGHVLADQYAMARRAGFDEIEIDDALAQRQPQDQWLRRANWRDHDYQARLRVKAS